MATILPLNPEPPTGNRHASDQEDVAASDAAEERISSSGLNVASLAAAERSLSELGDLVGSLQVLARTADEFRQPGNLEPHHRADLELRRRKLRNTLFGEVLFSDPAWELLLLLFCKQAKDEHPLTSELAVRSGIPLTTVVRWLLTLESRGLIWRKVHGRDRRATNVGLTEKGTGLMNRYFAH